MSVEAEPKTITRLEAARREVLDRVHVYAPSEIPGIEHDAHGYSGEEFAEVRSELRNLSPEAIDLVIMHVISVLAENGLFNVRANEQIIIEGLGVN